MRILSLNEETKQNLLENLLQRSPDQYEEYEAVVKDILKDVKERKDQAIFDYTLKFDKFALSACNIKVTTQEIDDAFTKVDPELIRVMEKAAGKIREYHEMQLRTSWMNMKEDGTILGQKVTPLDIVGVYVPGGKAVYPSSTLMCVVPAKVAGVRKIIMTTPPNSEGQINPAVLVAARIAGVDEIYKVGGAQAIAAMAYGTQSIPKVHKIVGPGNIFVALAKKSVYGHVSIDSIAGPSEILVYADHTANPKYIAADLLSQAEHDELASSILVTTDAALAKQVSDYVEQFTKEADREAIIRKSIDQYGYILICQNEDDAVDVINEIATEHLEILTANPFEVLPKIRHAGAIFLGEYSSEPLGDYFAGPNHVLPTNGTAKFFSPLNVDDFTKKSSIIAYSKVALEREYKEIDYFAKQEGLSAHAKSVRIRFEEE